MWPEVLCMLNPNLPYMCMRIHLPLHLSLSQCKITLNKNSFFHFSFPKGASEDLEKRRASERERKRKPVRFQSPDEDQKSKKKRKRRLNPLLRVPRRDPNAPFKCDLCGSPYVINPTRRGNRPKLSTHHPSPRHKVDPETGKTLTLCNACGVYFMDCLYNILQEHKSYPCVSRSYYNNCVKHFVLKK